MYEKFVEVDLTPLSSAYFVRQMCPLPSKMHIHENWGGRTLPRVLSFPTQRGQGPAHLAGPRFPTRCMGVFTVR